MCHDQIVNLEKIEPVSIYDCELEDFRCKCGCGYLKVHPELINRLNKMSAKLKVKFEITSGCRCSDHNIKVGGAKHSFHLSGQAVDIKCLSYTPSELLHWAIHFNFYGIIVHKTFIHLDIRQRRYIEPNKEFLNSVEKKT